MDWIIHVDTDELIHPAGAPEYSLTQLLSDVPANVDMVVFPNYVSALPASMSFKGHMQSFSIFHILRHYVFQESCVERDDIKEPFTEVLLIFFMKIII